jgi:hypothetical protein
MTVLGRRAARTFTEITFVARANQPVLIPKTVKELLGLNCPRQKEDSNHRARPLHPFPALSAMTAFYTDGPVALSRSTNVGSIV